MRWANEMATNSGKNSRKGSVKSRTQVFNPVTNQWVKRDSATGQFMAAKKDSEPFKGVRKEERKLRKPPVADPAFSRAARAAVRSLSSGRGGA